MIWSQGAQRMAEGDELAAVGGFTGLGALGAGRW